MTSEAKPVHVPCRSQNGHLIYPMLRHMIIHVLTRNRLLLYYFQNILVLMKDNLELKSHYVLKGQHVLVSSQK